ncbi:hypothetical protein K1Y72_06240 [Actinomadura sp. PM05-2]|uniref:Uncharacterized protein n=1 Tax=Actinomadura parmotrematis TaxID=2864039 RepID=A0ABS7FNJ4_9ACTN|nr:hypothetical protein [Actinomadura parmotrematis]
MPHVPLPEGRWGEPYRSVDGMWRACLRRPLTPAAEMAGLLSVVIAADLATLAGLQAQQDEQAARGGFHWSRA